MQTIKNKYDELFKNILTLTENGKLNGEPEVRAFKDTMDEAYDKAKGWISRAINKSDMSMLEKVQYGKLFR